MNLFDEIEFHELCNKLNVQPIEEDITIRYFKSSFFNQMKKSIRKDRQGEVVFCVLRPNGKAVTITCREYPVNTYRIPTGGIKKQEDILEAVYREVREELGLEVEILRFAGVLKIRFEYGGESEYFYSYLFILREKSGRLLEDAGDDEISEVREEDLAGLSVMVENLAKIKGKWADWGQFRYVTSNATYQYLKEHGQEPGLDMK